MENLSEIIFPLWSMLYVFGGAMFSAKQKTTFNLVQTVSYAEGLHASNNEIRQVDTVYIPYSGYISKHRAVWQQTQDPDINVYASAFSHIEGNPAQKWNVGDEDNYAKIISNTVAGDDAFSIMAEKLPMIAFFAPSNDEDVQVTEKDRYEVVKAGTILNVITEYASATNATSGQWTVVHSITFILGAFHKYGEDPYEGRDSKGCEVIIVTSKDDLSAVPHGWIPPSDGKIGNVRLKWISYTNEPTSTAGDYLYFGYGVPPAIRLEGTVDVLGNWRSENSHYTVGLTNLSMDLGGDQNLHLTSYSRRITPVHKGSPLAFGAYGGMDNNVGIVEFDFIPDYNNSAEWTIAFKNHATSSVIDTKPFILPFDCYIESVETDFVLEDNQDGKGFFHLYGVKQTEVETFFSTSEPVSGLWMKPDQGNLSLTVIGHGELLDSIPYANVAAVPIDGSSYETVGDFYPAGSVFYYHLADEDGNDVTDWRVNLNIQARVALKSKDYGTNLWDGLFVVREELDTVKNYNE